MLLNVVRASALKIEDMSGKPLTLRVRQSLMGETPKTALAHYGSGQYFRFT
jgi:hypothetical protein